MSRQCRSWRVGVQQLRPHPPQLPWLLLPLGRFFCVEDYITRRFKVPLDMGGARFFGFYPGGWIFSAYGNSSRHEIFNLHNHERELLPDAIFSRTTFLAPMLLDHPSTPMEVGIIMLAATFSCSPSPGDNCVAAAIVALKIPPYFPNRLALWLWVVAKSLDVIFYRGCFYYLTREGHLLWCKPVFDEKALLDQLQGVISAQQFNPVPLGRQYVKGRYLVMSQDAEKRTSRFRVFQADFAHMEWNEVQALQGCMIFISHGCSRSYKVENFTGCRFLNSVYYNDDCFEHVPMIESGYKKKYPSSDDVICSGPLRVSSPSSTRP
uniref:KIB1-4 beta-propeller domain-containing protein n=1 Tax=Setaria viridis TaxID=4556 RepID=A0A4U6SYQ4_SETVI|nr:hypothetical protein SEVIR_9G225900v2 [Setaria viridis]